MNLLRHSIALLFLYSTVALSADRTFSVPYDDLKVWTQSIVINLKEVTVLGSSGVHRAESDCEMHFGASVKGYAGDPVGWVLEPMNVCVVPFFGKSKQANSDWIAFGASLKNKTIGVDGVPRIWPEHLIGKDSPSNPNHAMEIHPVTRMTVGNKLYDFTKFIFAPEGFQGGLSQTTAVKILTSLEVNVTRNGNEVEIEFDAGRIGNFTVFDLRIRRDKIESRDDGQRIIAEVVLEDKKALPVKIVTIKGTEIHTQLERFRTGRRASTRLDGLVLFSLDPAALADAARAGGGETTIVEKPLQLILYGVAENE